MIQFLTICVRCGGHGSITKKFLLFSVKRKCSMCDGLGRVKKSTKRIN